MMKKSPTIALVRLRESPVTPDAPTFIPQTTADKIKTTVAKSCNGAKNPKKISAKVLAPAESPEVRDAGSYAANATTDVIFVAKYAENKPTQKRSAVICSATKLRNDCFTKADI